MDFISLTCERIDLIGEVYRQWHPAISYYFPIEMPALRHTLFAQPEVHPAAFEMSEDASLIAVESNPSGWVQAGYLSVHCAAAAGCELPCDMIGNVFREDDLIVEPIRIEDGYALVPSKPGLGVELDREAVRKYQAPVD